MNIRFILFVFVRFLALMFMDASVTTLLAYLIMLPSSSRITDSIALGVVLSILPTVFIFPYSFLYEPYHDCKNGKHVLVAEFNPDDAWWYCKKCNYKREFTVEEYRVITIKKYIRMYPKKIKE